MTIQEYVLPNMTPCSDFIYNQYNNNDNNYCCFRSNGNNGDYQRYSLSRQNQQMQDVQLQNQQQPKNLMGRLLLIKGTVN